MAPPGVRGRPAGSPQGPAGRGFDALHRAGGRGHAMLPQMCMHPAAPALSRGFVALRRPGAEQEKRARAKGLHSCNAAADVHARCCAALLPEWQGPQLRHSPWPAAAVWRRSGGRAPRRSHASGQWTGGRACGWIGLSCTEDGGVGPLGAVSMFLAKTAPRQLLRHGAPHPPPAAHTSPPQLLRRSAAPRSRSQWQCPNRPLCPLFRTLLAHALRPGRRRGEQGQPRQTGARCAHGEARGRARPV